MRELLESLVKDKSFSDDEKINAIEAHIYRTCKKHLEQKKKSAMDSVNKIKHFSKREARIIIKNL